MKIYHSSPGSRRVMIRAFICLVALVIALAIIAPFVIPRIDRNTRLINSHRIDAILQDMRNLDVVLNDYRADHGGRYPESLRELENNGWVGASADRAGVMRHISGFMIRKLQRRAR